MSRTPDRVQAELEKLDCHTTNPIVEALASSLLPNEILSDALAGETKRDPWDANLLIGLTSVRVIFVIEVIIRPLFRKANSETTVYHFYWQDVAQVDVREDSRRSDKLVDGPDGRQICITGYGGIGILVANFKFDTMPLPQFRVFTERLQTLVARLKATPQPGNDDKIRDQMRSLLELRRKGILTEDAFMLALENL